MHKPIGKQLNLNDRQLRQLKLELGVFWNQIETYESEKKLIQKETFIVQLRLLLTNLYWHRI